MTQQDKLIANEHKVMAILQDFSLSPSAEVNISLYNMEDDGETQYSFSNIAKMIEDLNINNVKVVDGKVVDLEGSPVTAANADKLGNKTVEEVRAGIDAQKLGGEAPDYFRNTFNRIKMLVDTEQTSFPAEWMAGVTWENEIVFWGYNYGAYFIPGLGTSNVGVQTIPHPVEKQGVLVGKLYANTRNLFVLYEDGDLYALGYNGYGQLGIGNTANQFKLIKSAENVVKLSTSSVGYHQDHNHVMILKSDQTVWLTGNNDEGQLGNGNETHQNTWIKADVPSAKDILAIGTNHGNSYILTVDGKVWASGVNSYGQLGDGSTARSFVFKKISNISDHNIVKMVGAGGTRNGSSTYYFNFVLFLTDTGRVFAVGHNGYGQLGVGNTEHQKLPIEIQYGHDNSADPIVEVFTSKAALGSAGYITQSGKLYMMGNNSYRELGLGDMVNRTVPTLVMENIEYVQAMSSGTYSYYRTYIARKKDKSWWTWGYNGNGQCGDGTTSTLNTPKQLRVNHPEKVIQVSQGGYSFSTHWNFLLEDGRVYGVGANNYRQSYVYANSSNIRQPIRTFI